MDINELIAIIKKKLTDQIDMESIEIEDKSFLHKNHARQSRRQTSSKNYFEFK